MNIQTVTHKGISFLNIHNPQELEIKFLRKTYGFNPLNLEDYVNKTQVPKIETYKGYTHVVLDFPHFDENGQKTTTNKYFSQMRFPLPNSSSKRIFPGHVAFFIGKDYLVVLHDERTPQIDSIFSLCQEALRHREEFMGEGPVFLFYRIADMLVDASFLVMNDLSTTIDHIDRQLAENRSPRVVEEISTTRRNLVVFQTMIKPILPIFADLEKSVYKELNGSMTPFWSNVLDHLQKIWDRLEDNRELIEGISESNESLLVVRSNEVIRVLTILFTLTIPGTLVGTFYGMNILIPGGLESGSWMFLGPFTTFYFVVGLTMFAMVGMFLYFKYKDWF